VFPHTAGIISGFGSQGEVFEQWQEHHIKSPDGKKEYDFTVYNIVKYFQLCMQNNPNMLDSLFTPDNCVIHATPISKLVRDNRKMFLHKGSWHKYKGYAFSQMGRYATVSDTQKLGRLANFMTDFGIPNAGFHDNFKIEVSRRKDMISADFPDHVTHLEDLTVGDFNTYEVMINQLTTRQLKSVEAGIDTKSMYHIVRLMLEAEQIMTEHDLDLLRNREQLKSIRRGEWSLERLVSYFHEKEAALEQVYLDSTLQRAPDEEAIRRLLLQCLEEAYGDVGSVIKKDTSVDRLVKELELVIALHR
jgi:hypothetical protein